MGFDVVTAHDALTTLTLASESQPDVVCIDVDMPGGNGLSACEMLATDPNHSSIPLIIMTGKTDEQTIRRCHEMGFYYVLKGTDVWGRVSTLIQELFDVALEPATQTEDL